MAYDLLVFDLDGTLIHSAPDIVASLQAVQRRLGRPVLPDAVIVDAIGKGVRQLIEKTTAPPHAPVLAAFMAEYAEHLLDRTRLYDGVAETLDALPQRKIILSNKPEALSKKAVDGLGIARHFEAVYGGDSFPTRKPDAEAFRRAVAGARAPVMIGDSGIDVQTARNAGAPVVAVTYGYAKPGELDGVEARVARFSELPNILARNG
ncbi:MAG TPA: HAD-IA family hydrolase [Planctomycetota bacterium]